MINKGKSNSAAKLSEYLVVSSMDIYFSVKQNILFI